MATRAGIDLINHINTLRTAGGQLAIWGLGQAGMILKGAASVVYLDPYLSDFVETVHNGPRRAFPAPVQPTECTNANVVLITHEHADHTDPHTLGPLAMSSPGAQFLGTSWTKGLLMETGVADARVTIARVGEPLRIAGCTVHPTPAMHYSLDHDAALGHKWLGYIVELNGVMLWHSGDTILFDGLLAALAPWRNMIDIVCLPVNGRDYWRDQKGIIGNMDATEALDLCAWLGADVLIPMHNDLFAANHVTPAVLAEYQDRKYARQKYHWLQPGELYYYVK